VSLDHSIDPIVPHARAAAAKTTCLVLVYFMEASMVRLNHALHTSRPLIYINRPTWLARKCD
jgi:hypothetical protein